MENLISVGLKNDSITDFLQNSAEALTNGDDRFQKVLEQFADEVETAKDGADTLEQSASKEDVESGSSSRIPKDLTPEMVALMQLLPVSALSENPAAIGELLNAEGVDLGNVSGLEKLDTGRALLNSGLELPNAETAAGISKVPSPQLTASQIQQTIGNDAQMTASSPLSGEATTVNSDVSTLLAANQPIFDEKTVKLKGTLTVSNEESLKPVLGFNIKPEIKGESIQPIQPSNSEQAANVMTTATDKIVGATELETPTAQVEPKSESPLPQENLKAVGEQASFKENLFAQIKSGSATKENLPADFQESTISLPINSNEIIADEIQALETKQPVSTIARPMEIYSQIVDKAHLMVEAGNSEITINLKPDHLGRLNLKISLENNLITAEFVAESEQVKAAIESNLSDLRQMLHDSGVQVEGMMVSVGGNQTGEGFESDFAQYRNDNQTTGIKEEVDLESLIDDRPIAVTETTIDLRA